MTQPAMDPNLLQDFLTEARELIEQLDADLVTLETVAGRPEARDLLNQIFRALHTIKGAASFLGLTAVTGFAHAAEDALNRLRKGEARVTARVMDALLRSVDVVRGMLEQLAAGEEITPGPQELIDALRAIAEAPAQGGAAPDAAPQAGAPAAAPNGANDTSSANPAPQPAGPAQRQLDLPAQKADLLTFMVDDLHQQAQRMRQALEAAADPAARGRSAAALGDATGELVKTAEFFDLPDLKTLCQAAGELAGRLCELSNPVVEQAIARLGLVVQLIDEQGQALGRSLALSWPLERLLARLAQLGHDQALEAALAPSGDVQTLRALDLGADAQAAVAHEPTPAAGASARTPAANVEQTLRVEVGRLEALLNLVGQLVLTKNRLLAMSRKARDRRLPLEMVEEMAGACGDLDRLTGELQVGVMRTRMQPLAKLFDRYPRVIRDLSRMMDKQIHLEIVGKETEVDKSVLELLADPLVHILRNAADHGIETPAARQAAGKDPVGTVRLTAEHQGSHVRVEIRDDGKGLDRAVLERKTVEKGLVSAQNAAELSDEEVYRFIFVAGFSTAEKVTDLSGRGVGMDVVRTNIARLNGQANVFSAKGRGTTIEILIPLTVAIMPAMVVGVGQALYCVPLQSILEIVRPQESMLHSVGGQAVMRLRDQALPLVDLRWRLTETGGEGGRFAVVVGVGGQRAGLLVDRLIGQQEIVIKPLDDAYTAGGPFSGATIREDGDVCLILDVIQLIRQTRAADRAAA